MKRYSIIFAFILTLCCALFSCNKEFLPPNAIDSTRAVETKDDVWAWYNGFMTYFRLLQNGDFVLLQEYQADMLNATLTFGNRGALHDWSQFTTETAGVAGVYAAYYYSIRNVNFFLEKVENYSPQRSGETDTVHYAKATAHFFRAYCYTELANRWSRLYDASALCVPAVTRINLKAQDPRATQEKILALIKEDLNAATSELNAITGSVGRNIAGERNATSITLDIVKALSARVALLFHDYQEAYELANELIGNGRYALITTSTQLKAMWHEDAPSSELLMLVYADNKLEKPNDMGVFIQEVTHKSPHPAQPDFVPSQWVVDLYEAGDFRRAIYFRYMKILLRDDKTQMDGWVVNKYPGAPALNIRENVSNYLHRPKPFRLAELYLIAAEAAKELGNDIQARNALNTLRKARGLAETASSGDALQQEIRDERTRELAFEGYRLTDLRRWGMSCKRHNPQSERIVNKIFTEVDYPNDHPKFVWPIPNHDITCNPHLVQNIGW